MEVRFFEGEWVRKSAGAPETVASREEIMMVLEDIDNILIKLQYNEGILNTTISNIEMDSAATPDSGLGAAVYVEQCSCPVGYTGSSCEVGIVSFAYDHLLFLLFLSVRDVQMVMHDRKVVHG